MILNGGAVVVAVVVVVVAVTIVMAIFDSYKFANLVFLMSLMRI